MRKCVSFVWQSGHGAAGARCSVVTHGSVIFPLAGTNPREAEGFVLKPAPGTAEGFAIIGKIGPGG